MSYSEKISSYVKEFSGISPSVEETAETVEASAGKSDSVPFESSGNRAGLITKLTSKNIIKKTATEKIM